MATKSKAKAAEKTEAAEENAPATPMPDPTPAILETPEGAPVLITTPDGAIVNITDGVTVYEPTRYPPAALAVKVAKVMGDITRVEKRGKNTEQHYDYAQESDVMEMLRPILARHGLAVFIECVHHSADEIGKTRNGNAFMRHRVRMQYTLVDADTGGAWTMVYPGEANDSGDKGIYKAMTGATKYWALKAFLIGTGDDPERDTGEGDLEHGGGRAASSSGGGQGGGNRRGNSNRVGTPSTTDPMSDAQKRKLFAVANTIDELEGTQAATDYVRTSMAEGSVPVIEPGSPPSQTLSKAEASELIEKLVKREAQAKAAGAVKGPATEEEGGDDEPEGDAGGASSEEPTAEQADAFDKPGEGSPPAGNPFEEEDDLPF